MEKQDSLDSINLNNREIRYRELFQHLKSGVAIYNAVDNRKDFVFVDINKAAEKFDSVKKENVIGKRVTQIFKDVKIIGLFEIFQKVWKTGKTICFPVLIYKNFRIFACRENTVYKLPTGEIVVIYDERTEEVRNEKSKHAIHNISKAVNSSISLEQLYLKIHQELNQTVNTLNFFVALYKKKEKIIVFPYFVDQYDPAPAEFSISDTNSLTVKVIKEGKSLLLKKKDILNITDQQVKSKYGKIPEIWFGVPLKIKNQCIGALVVQSYDNKNLYSKKDVSLLESISDHIAFSIEMKKIENALRKSEKRYKYIVDTLKEGIALVDSKENFIFANPATKKIFGVDKLIGMNLKSFFSKKDFKKIKEETKKRIKGEKSVYELTITRPDKSERIILLNVVPTFDDNNNFFSSFGVFSDITEKKNIEFFSIGFEKILFVDDEILLGELALDTLQRLSYTVTTFSDSRKAIDNFKKNPNNYDIIITDMNMPFLNGIEFSKEVRKIRKNIPIIICTGYADDKFIQMVEKIAINKILQKPIHIKDLGKAIQEVLSNTKNNVNL